MSNIQKQSRRVRMLLQSLFVLTPIMVCYFWLTVETPYDFISATGIFYLTYDIGYFTMLPLAMTTRIVAAFTSLLMSSILMYALMVLIRLFRNYERGEIFSLENAMSYQKLGYSLFYWVLGSIIYYYNSNNSPIVHKYLNHGTLMCLHAKINFYNKNQKFYNKTLF